MRVIVVIPARNEEDNIKTLIKNIPRSIPHVSEVKVLVVDDGSTDDTSRKAREAGADYVVSFKRHRGLALAFKTGVKRAVELSADIIVNIDADNQYNPQEIPRLVEPIIENKVDIVLGDRQVNKLEHMPWNKKIGNSIVSYITSGLSGQNIRDSQTGFRALSREAALRINIFSNYTYTQEMILEAAYKKLRVIEIPVEFRKREGESRLISNIFTYALKVAITIFRSFLYHHPLRSFLYISFILFGIGALFAVKVFYQLIETGSISPFYPSTIAAAVFLIVGFQTLILGFLAELSRSHRLLMEDILYTLENNSNLGYDKFNEFKLKFQRDTPFMQQDTI